MHNLLIEFELGYGPVFGITKWQDEEYEIPLKLKFKDFEAEIYIRKPMHFFKDKFGQRDFTKYRITFLNAPVRLLAAVSGLNKKDEMFAVEKIYDAYRDVHLAFESYLRSAGKIEDLFSMGAAPMDEVFRAMLNPVHFSIDNGKKYIFAPTLKKPRGKAALFSAKQLLTPSRWKGIQNAVDRGKAVIPEIDELQKIKARLVFRDTRRFAILEAIILIEYSLGQYVEKHLLSLGWSKNRIKDYKKELTLNLMLNILLPTTLTKTKLKAMNKHIANINVLRKTRNEIMHEKMADTAIDAKEARKGINSAIKLMNFLY